jgi:hypothetical protein
MPYIDDAEYEQLKGDASLTEQDRIDRGLDDLTSIDQKLINYAGVLPPTRIAELTGVPAEEVAKRTLEVLNSIDYFTVEQMRAKQIIMLNSMIAEALNRLPTASDKAAPAYMNATGGNIHRAIKELEAMEARAQANHSAMEQAYARRMVYIVGRAFDRQLGKLAERFPAVAAGDIAAEFRATILEIAREIDAEG